MKISKTLFYGTFNEHVAATVKLTVSTQHHPFLPTSTYP